jgi:imidazoleglycerol-phosphate dehydratase
MAREYLFFWKEQGERSRAGHGTVANCFEEEYYLVQNELYIIICQEAKCIMKMERKGDNVSGQSRLATVARTTSETDIAVELNLDGAGSIEVQTGVGFLDHMLTLFGVHGFFDLKIQASGDTHIDDHHTVEDVGICLGQALNQALGDRSGICRYGTSFVPMDETLVRVSLDLSNRPYLHYEAATPDQKVGSFDTALAKEFMRALAQHGGMTLHVDLLHGENSHHIIEAVFKATARALAAAAARRDGLQGQLSSKGML